MDRRQSWSHGQMWRCIRLRPMPIAPVPHETVRVARAACPQGHRSRRLADEVETWCTDDACRALFSTHGQPAWPPWRLARATILPVAEGRSDRQAAHAVRSRIDWTYVLRLERTDPGVEAPVLREFRTRLLAGTAEDLLCDTRLPWCRDHGLGTAGGRQRTDATHIVAAVRALNRIEPRSGSMITYILPKSVRMMGRIGSRTSTPRSAPRPMARRPLGSTPRGSRGSLMKQG
jgi:transposase